MEKLRKFATFGKKIVCVGRNYSEHAAELGNPVPQEPVIFMKPTTSYIEQGQAIQIPIGVTELHHEVELGVVIGRNGRLVNVDEASQLIGGYCLALDMTDRQLQNKLKSKGLPWTLAKGFDTACPVSEFIPHLDSSNIDIWLKVNGQLKQHGNTKDMIFPIPYILSYISQRMTLEVGDLVLTGTPSGVGPVQAGDVIECGLGLGDSISMKFTVCKVMNN